MPSLNGGHLNKGDRVVVVSGVYAGETGEVVEVFGLGELLVCLDNGQSVPGNECCDFEPEEDFITRMEQDLDSLINRC